jgi:hypothetical protein
MCRGNLISHGGDGHVSQTSGRMKSELARHYAMLFAAIIATALLLSLVWRVPYVFTLIGFSAWAFFGHLITADDDLAGGWSNPDGLLPFPWIELLIKAIVLCALCALVILYPTIRGVGGPS